MNNRKFYTKLQSSTGNTTYYRFIYNTGTKGVSSHRKNFPVGGPTFTSKRNQKFQNAHRAKDLYSTSTQQRQQSTTINNNQQQSTTINNKQLYNSAKCIPRPRNDTPQQYNKTLHSNAAKGNRYAPITTTFHRQANLSRPAPQNRGRQYYTRTSQPYGGGTPLARSN